MHELGPFGVKDDEFALSMDQAMTEWFEGLPTRKEGVRRKLS